MWDKYENISDELLAAFLDGNTTREETKLVLRVMNCNRDLMEVVDIVQYLQDDLHIDNDEERNETDLKNKMMDNPLLVALLSSLPITGVAALAPIAKVGGITMSQTLLAALIQLKKNNYKIDGLEKSLIQEVQNFINKITKKYQDMFNVNTSKDEQE
jgi:hypothetical protein